MKGFERLSVFMYAFGFCRSCYAPVLTAWATSPQAFGSSEVPPKITNPFSRLVGFSVIDYCGALRKKSVSKAQKLSKPTQSCSAQARYALTVGSPEKSLPETSSGISFSSLLKAFARFPLSLQTAPILSAKVKNRDR